MERKIILPALLVFAAIGHLFSQQWYVSYIPHGRSVADIQIKSIGDIQVIGGNYSNDSMESIFRSGSAGVSWDFIDDHPLSSWLKSFAYDGTMNGVAVGTNGKIKRTVDGGAAWSYISSPINSDFGKIVFKTNHQAIVVGGRNADTTQSVMQSTDDGLTWTVLRHQHGPKFNSVAFSDSLTGVAVGDSGIIYKTTDGGTTWSSIPSPISWALNDVVFADPNTLIAIGGIEYDSSRRTILRSIDGGNSWSISKDEPGAWLNDVCFMNVDTGYIVGDSAMMYQTIDGGTTWSPMTVTGATVYDDFNAVDFTSADFGIVATYGRLFIFCQPPAPTLQTLGVTQTGSTSGMMFGQLNTHDFPATYSFVYDTTAAFLTPSAVFYPPSINSDTLSIVSNNYGNLVDNKTYYYYLQANNISGNTYYGDTLSFTTAMPNYFFQTTWWAATSDTSVVLNGSVSNLPDTTLVYFEYGSSQDLTNSLTTPFVTISDTQMHQLSADIGNLTPYQTYYYRLRGQSGSNIYIGGTQQFFVGRLVDSLVTLPVTNTTTSSATLNAWVTGSKFPLNFSFEYGPTIQLGNTTNATPNTVSDSLPHSLSANLSSLQPFTNYYYRIRADWGTNRIYGSTMSFNTGSVVDTLQTLTATNVNGSSAQLNGFVRGAQAGAALSFEYGTTNSLGSQVTANQSPIADTLFHNISAVISGLNTNTVYYYRIRLDFSGQTRYGEIRQLYTGSSPIINWDFQLWQKDTLQAPVGWNMMQPNFAKVATQSGSALKLIGTNFALLGIIGDEFYPGQAIHSRPDSLSVYLNYSIDLGDTAFVGVFMMHADTPVVMDYNPVVGSSGNNFVKKVFPIHYLSPSQPDSLIIGFISTNMNTLITNHPNNFMTIAEVSFIPNNEPIYNGNFETWRNLVIDQPLGWANVPLVFNDSTKGYAIQKVLHQAPDDYAAEIQTVPYHSYYLSMSLTNINKFTGAGDLSPVYTKPQTFTGYYRYFPVPGDTAQLYVTLYNHHQQVGSGELLVWDTVPDFTPFEIPISYNYQPLIPDSVALSFNSSNNRSPHGGSRLAVDKLNFDGFIGTGISEIFTSPQSAADGVKVYPVPSRSNVVVDWSLLPQNNFDIEVIDLTGNAVLRTHANSADKRVVLNTSQLSSGFYLISLRGGGKTISKKMVIAK